MGKYIEPLDFRTIFIEYFLGRTELFVFAMIILMSFLCAKMGMSNRIFMILLAICSLILSATLGNVIYIFVIFLIGITTYKGVAKLFT